jgi:hypothetical protein
LRVAKEIVVAALIDGSQPVPWRRFVARGNEIGDERARIISLQI